MQWIYGFVVFFYPGGNTSIRSESLPWHVLFGIFVYALAIATAAIGFLEKLTFLQNGGLDKFGSEAFLVNFTAIATILFGAFVLLTVYAQKDQEEEDYAGSYSAIWISGIRSGSGYLNFKTRIQISNILDRMQLWYVVAMCMNITLGFLVSTFVLLSILLESKLVL